jgi:signal transduction histidine kinase
MRRLTHKKSVSFFALLLVLVLAQVGWWALVFTRDADIIAELKLAQADLLASHAGVTVSSEVREEVQSEAFHRKVMFLSESAFFALVSLIALVLIYRSLRAERRSREIQRNFIEIVSHESKTPLTALKLRLESLRETAGTAEAALSLGLALDEVRRLAGVLDKTMELNRSERQALRFESIRFAEVVESVVRRLDPWLSSRKVKVVLDLDSEVHVLGDFTSLQNGVQSLLENAVLYNPNADRQVVLTLRGQPMEAILTVADNGPGISTSDQERIFERFYRGQSGKSVSGTGLGLYLAKVIVEAHRGALRLVHATVGARFEITLPRVVA